MFLSTQSVSRPKRDSIYSFLMHLGPLGCITTEIFSENPSCSNLAKTRFLKKEYSHASTDHQVQFSIGSSIFQRPWHTQGLWKIAKKPNPVVKFGCGSVRKFAYFFQKMEFKFSKNREKYKKNSKNSEKIKNEAGAMYCLIYIFFRFYCWRFNFQTNRHWQFINTTSPPSSPMPNLLLNFDIVIHVCTHCLSRKI